jgi:hypothetical protein
MLLAGNWWLFMRSVVGNAEATVMFIPLPLITLLLLVLARRSLLQPPSASGTGIQRQVTA